MWVRLSSIAELNRIQSTDWVWLSSIEFDWVRLKFSSIGFDLLCRKLRNGGLFHVYTLYIHVASSKHEGGWEDSRELCKLETQSRVCTTFNNSSSPQVFRWGYMYTNMEKVLYWFSKIFLKLCTNLKSYNLVYILSSKHTYWPMTVRIVSQLFYTFYYKQMFIDCSHVYTICIR